MCEFGGDPRETDITDLLIYLAAWFASDPVADIDGSAVVTISDLLAFLECWFIAEHQGC